jgi:hypothetical protein
MRDREKTMTQPNMLVPVNQFTQAVSGMPWIMHVIIGSALLAGATLWLVGRSVIRPATATIGAAFGAAAGFVMLPVMVPQADVSPYLAMVAGLFLGLVGGLLLCRVATAITFGSVLGAGFGLIAAAGLSVAGIVRGTGAPATAALAQTGIGGDEQPLLPPAEPAMDDQPAEPDYVDPGPDPNDVERPATRPAPIRRPATTPGGANKANPAAGKNAPGTQQAGAANDADPSTQAARIAAQEMFRAEPGTPAYQAQQLYASARASLSESWNATPVGHRLWISAAGVMGLLLGTLAGIAMPLWAAAAVTSLVGSAVMLPSGVWLAHAFDVPGRGMLDLSPLSWALVWLIVALIGFVVQSQGLLPDTQPAGAGRKKGKKKPKRDEE